MHERIPQSEVYQLQPALAQSLIHLGQTALESGLDAKLIYLIKLRVSQINGCAFCQHMNINEARRQGESQARLDILNAWRDVPFFNKKERAALSWAETLTFVAQKEVSDKDFALIAAEFSSEEIVNLTAAIVAINSWNRIAIAFRFVPKIQ